MQRDRYARANALALFVPGALMAGALGSQYVGGLFPCEMCHWQRWPHYAAIAIALVAFATKAPIRPVLIALAALAILTSGGIGVFHAGVEYHWWAGPPCSASGAGMSIEEIMRAPIIRCDQAQWTLGPVSLAGFNAIFSILGGLAVLVMVGRAK
jgi:disulfide bond formation protein DsbB